MTCETGSHAKVRASAEIRLAAVCWCGTCCEVVILSTLDIC